MHGHIDLNAYWILMILGTVSLGLATANVPGLPRWSWFPGGVFLIVLAQFFV